MCGTVHMNHGIHKFRKRNSVSKSDDHVNFSSAHRLEREDEIRKKTESRYMMIPLHDPLTCQRRLN